MLNTGLWRGMLRPPSNPPLSAPLPEQRSDGGAAPRTPALIAERRTIMVAAPATAAEHAAWPENAAARVSPSALLRQSMARTRIAALAMLAHWAHRAVDEPTPYSRE